MSLPAPIGNAARWLVRKALPIYYPRIEIDCRERLPAGGAVLFVANHPNSLMDPAVIGFTAQRSVHFFAKAPLFEVPVFGALMQAVVHLDDEHWQPFLDELEVLLPPAHEAARDSIAALRQRKVLADAINYFFRTDRARAEVVGAAMDQHRARLDALGLSVASPVMRLGVARLTGRLLVDTLRLLLGLGPALAGTLHHLIPFAITRGGVQFVKHPGRATLALNRVMIGLPVYGLWYAAVWWLLAMQTPVWIAWLWTALMPLAGVAALHYFWRVRHAGRAWWQELKMVLQPARLRRLRVGQVSLRRQLEQLRAEYQARPAGTSTVATGG